MATEKSMYGVPAAASTVHDYSEVPLSDHGNTPNQKTATATTTTAVSREDDSLIANENGVAQPDRDLKAAIWTIVRGVALPCIPIIAVSVALLAMVLTKRIKIESGWPELRLAAAVDDDHTFAHKIRELRHEAGRWAYYTDRNPTTITTVASWTSRVLPYLTSSIMALVAFFAARSIATKSKHSGGDDLPTPTEVTLLINLLSGKDLAPLKDTLLHRWAYKKKLADPIPLAFTASSLITFVGISIPIIDTWFGISTTPQTIVVLSNNTDGPHQYGRSLSTTLCPQGPGSFVASSGLQWIPCNLAVDEENNGDRLADPSFQLIGADNAARVAQNLGMDNTVGLYKDIWGSERPYYYYLQDP
ncbi:hypothetical protein LTR78_001766 [Recurvomyces mirabilis]|uniref:Uncharacterized protein n=1 Tax=Recurvomyces mirabilis TaxID=574656 RepID=A0AAE1C582_9PEZI|nr:hypothetical protein LTR78_001766 [Recurvomyces mirabilis]KAK5150159.1 hypothetical protein LTS14_010288 [Recurvomyces mirabilis]